MAMADSAFQTYQQTYRNFVETAAVARDASSEVLADLLKQEDQLLQRLKELDRNALLLSGNRRAYVGENGEYVDRNGDVLTGEAHEEAAALHAENPQATRWEERDLVADQVREIVRQREEVEHYIAEIDDLETRAGRGELSQEQLQEAQEKLMENMPPPVRERFDQKMTERDAGPQQQEEPQASSATVDTGDFLELFGNIGDAEASFPALRTTSYAKLDGEGIHAAPLLQSPFVMAANPAKPASVASNPEPPANDAGPGAEPQNLKPPGA